MHDIDWLAQRLEEHRNRLTTVAYRMLGSTSEADERLTAFSTGGCRGCGP
jgi:DNA-directed RNA polymerase specialized sigma24 family protein